MSHQHFLHWPGWKQLGYAAKLALAQGVLFVVVFVGTDWIAGRHSYRVPVALEIDSATPLVPWMAAIYLSLNVMFCLTPFVLQTRRELQGIVLAQAAATLIAGVGFLLLPAEEIHSPPSEEMLGAWAGVFHFARQVSLRHNYLPSLHVAYTAIYISAFMTRAQPREKMLLACWGTAIVASTLLIHEHYVLDVATGLILGWATVFFIYRPWSRKAPVPAV